MKFSRRGAGLAALGIFAIFARTAQATDCSTNADCSAEATAKTCNPNIPGAAAGKGLCVQCLSSSTCAAATPSCDSTGTCVAACNSDAQCTTGTKLKCKTSSGGNYCVTCLVDTDCTTAGTPVCSTTGSTANTCVAGCLNDAACPLTAPKCDPVSRKCIVPGSSSLSSSSSTAAATTTTTALAIPTTTTAAGASSAEPSSAAGSSTAAAGSSTAAAGSSSGAAGSSTAAGSATSGSPTSGSPSSASSPAATLLTPPPNGCTGPVTLAYTGTVPQALVKTLGTCTSVNVQIGDQAYLLTSVGCKSVPAGQSIFVATGAFSPTASSELACASSCVAGFARFYAYSGGACFCGSTLRTDLPQVQCPGAAPGKVRRQGSTTVQGVQIDAPVGITSSSSSSSSTSRSSTSSTTSSGSTVSTSSGSVSTSSGSASTSSGSVSTSSGSASTSSGSVSTSSGSVSTSSGSSTFTTSTSTTASGEDFPTDFPTDTATATSGSATASATAGVSPNPVNVGGFTYLGCFGSPSSFPTFTLTLSAQVMTIDRCIAACTVSKRYAAVFGNDCFCGDFVDDVNEVKVSDDQCNIPCPGNSAQRCGGRTSAPVLKRQLPGVIASDIRFTIYLNAAVNATIPVAPGGATTVATATVNGVVTVVTTVIPTGYPTGGVCANGKCGNIPCYGDDCYKVIIGYGEFCGFDYTCFGPDCMRRLVCNEGVWRPEVCNGYDCGRKVVCTSGKCKYVTKDMEEYNQKITCYGNYCQVEACTGDACNKKYVCTDGSCIFQTCPLADAGKKYDCSGNNCTVVPSCSVCSAPAAPCATCGVVISQPPITTTACNGSACSAVVISQPPITKTPYQTMPPAQTGAQPPANPPANPPASNGAPQVPVATGTAGGKPTTPTTVVTAGTSKFVASFGALAFSVMAAAILL